MSLLTTNIPGECPAGGFCSKLVLLSELLVILLLVDCFVFVVTLIPPLFSWKSMKPDSRKRIFFAMFACISFYFWLGLLAVHSLYCFGFLAHLGPCGNKSSAGGVSSTLASDLHSYRASLNIYKDQDLDLEQYRHPATLSLEPDDLTETDANVEPFENLTSAIAEALTAAAECGRGETDSGLKNITLVNILIVVVLIVTLVANINEAIQARSLYYCETLCRKEDLQKFLSSLVAKKPEVGHIVNCFHTSKSPDTKTNTVHKVVTYSTVENFNYQTWKDFSDLRLIEPSQEYPVIEVEVILNFFPGDHSTADKYKKFVQKLTKENSGKDQRISIDDYFHIEDQREWSFFIGSQQYIVPWWERDPARICLSCGLLIGWIFRLTYKGQIAKHRMEVKKAVFCEPAAQDEGVSLTATPGSSTDGGEGRTEQEVVEDTGTNPTANGDVEPTLDVQAQAKNCLNDRSPDPSTPLLNPQWPHHPLTNPQGPHHPLANPQGSHHPLANPQGPHHPLANPQGPHHPLANHSPDRNHLSHRKHQPGNHPVRSAPLASPRTHIRETTKDIVTAVTHHDINGMNAVSTVALKDIDVQMSALSGYETYV